MSKSRFDSQIEIIVERLNEHEIIKEPPFNKTNQSKLLMSNGKLFY